MLHTAFELRPLGVGELLDTAFRLYRRHFWLFVGVVALVQVPLALVRVVYDVGFSPLEHLQSTTENSGDFLGAYTSLDDYYTDFWQVLLVQLIFVLVNLFAVYGLINGAMAHVIYRRYLGQRVDVWGAYRPWVWRWPRLVGAFVVLGVLDASLMLLFIIPCIGWIAALILLIFFNAPILSFLAPVIVVEDRGVATALGRAFSLGRRQFWRVLGVNILLGLLMGVLTGALTLLWNIAYAFWDPGFMLRTSFTALATLAVTLFVQPVVVCGLALLYFDLRVRLEGFDLVLRVAQLGVDREGVSA